MENLELLSERRVALPGGAPAAAAAAGANARGAAVGGDGDLYLGLEGGAGLSAWASDPSSQTLFFVRGRVLAAYSLRERALRFSCPLWSEVEDDGLLEKDDAVLALHYLAELERVFVASARGNMLLVDPVGDEHQVQSVALVQGGVDAVAWSPDNELCVVCASTGAVLLMTTDWDVLSEHALAHGEAGARETSLRASWRGDGQFFVVSSQLPGAVQQRRLRVFQRMGQLEQEGEALEGLSPLLAWRPDCSLIAATMRRRVGAIAKHEVVFFERNLHRHGEFVLPEAEAEARALAWSSDSSVLLVTREDARGAWRTELWGRFNYHWYLKLALPCAPLRLADAARWDAEDAMLLHLAAADGELRSLRLRWAFLVSPTPSHTAAVIDGETVHLTPLALTVVPPPMSAYQLELPRGPGGGGVLGAAFSPRGELAVLAWRPGGAPSLHLWESVEAAGGRAAPRLRGTLRLEVDGERALGTGLPRLLQWIDAGVFLVACADALGGDELVELCFGESEAGPQLVGASPLRAPGPVLQLAPRVAQGFVAVELADGSVLRLTPSLGRDERDATLTPMGRLPTPCAWFAVVSMADEAVLVGLDARGRLYLNDTLISPQCTSFCAQPGNRFLAFTIGGAQNAMFFLDLALSLAQTLDPAYRSDPHIVRFIERGSRLVTVAEAPPRPRVVLEHPRGNLETVTPRVLALFCANWMLSRRDYRGALLLLRAQRIDLNLIVDHAPADLLAHCADLVRAVDDPELISLFASELRDESVIVTQFPGYRPLAFADASRSGGDGASPDAAAAPDGAAGALSDDEELIEDADEDPAQRAALEAALRGQGQSQQTPAASIDEKDEKEDSAHASAGPRGRGERPRRGGRGGRARGRGGRGDAQSYNPRRGPEARERFMAEQAARAAAVEALEQRAARELAAAERGSGATQWTRLLAERGKVNAVCEALVEALDAADARRFMPSVLTCLAKQSPPRLADALVRVRALMAERKRAEAALKHLIFLADADALFDVALGLYDLELVLLVARHSQRDPKEYLPELERLRALPPPLMRYEIDQRLRRFDSALRNLAAAGPEQFDACVRLAAAHGLFDTALQLFPPPPRGAAPAAPEAARWRRVVAAMAEHLSARGERLDAGRAFAAAGEAARAIVELQAAGEWRECLCVAHASGLDAAALRALAAQLATAAADARKPLDAARILLEYCSDVDGAVRVLTDGRQFVEAMRVARLHAREALVRERVLPFLLTSARGLAAKLAQRRAELVASCARLRVLRTMMLLDSTLAGATAAKAREETASLASGLTGASGASGVSASSGISTASSIFSLDLGPAAGASRGPDRRGSRGGGGGGGGGGGRGRKGKPRSPAEEESLVLERVRALQPSAAVCEAAAAHSRALSLVGEAALAATLQGALAALLDEAAREAQRGMPMPATLSPEQAALAARWNWAADVAPPRPQPESEPAWRLAFLRAPESLLQHAAAGGSGGGPGAAGGALLEEEEEGGGGGGALSLFE